ncbi:hypothetical protein BX600DRAFT_514568 [Xylariales sp. PMI_506]|nr:hypothetical protein BX600DRAFT_514568 [Xylariales sp. PMI_506]
MVPFAGYHMPLEYSNESQKVSHRWTRENASLFDVSHMVQHRLSGALAEEFLMTITPSSIDKLASNTSTLSTLLNDKGGIVDDTVISRLGPESFYFVTNAACRDGDLTFLSTAIDNLLKKKAASADQIQWEILPHHGLLALQGPKAAKVLQALIDAAKTVQNSDLSTLYFGQSRWLQIQLIDGTVSPSLLVSRTGYTGEDGFEISISASNPSESRELSEAVAQAFLADDAVRWAGLAARDSLRLEAGMCLYGHDISEATTPPMAGLGWIVGKDRRDPEADGSIAFNGQSVILAQLKRPSTMPLRRVGLMLLDKGPAAREGAEVLDAESEEVIGKVTSGCPSITLGNQNIAMALVKNGFHKSGTALKVKIRTKVLAANVVKTPFVEARFFRSS